MSDQDQTVEIPWWIWTLVKLLPEPWSKIVETVLKAIDMLPAPQRTRAFLHAVSGEPEQLNRCVGEACGSSADRK